MPKYIFIVGLPRTGTKLMVNILGAAPGYACHLSPENFFLGRAFLPGAYRKMKRYGDLHVDANIHQLVDAMYTGKFHGEYWDRLQNGTMATPRPVMAQALLASDRSACALYTTLLQVHASSAEPVILGDKTGPHLYHVQTLLQWFPDAKVIHTFRDPRAILASEHKKRMAQLDRRAAKAWGQHRYAHALALRLVKPLVSLAIVLYITMAWLRAARLHYRYKRRYPQHYYVSKFEDLVNDPMPNVQRLCHFLGVTFQPAMLHPPTVDSSFAQKSEHGFDQDALTRWQSGLRPWMKRWLLFCVGKDLKKFGYVG